MPDEPIKTDDEQTTDYIAAIAELKDKSVPKEQYLKLKEENTKLLKSLINGETLEGVEQPSRTDVAELRKQLYSGEVELSDIDYLKKSLELRSALIEQGERDPFLPFGEKITPTNEDIEAAERCAKIVQECIDYANGDNSILINELQRVMIDTGPKGR